MSTRHRPRFRIADYRATTDSVRVGCLPLLLAMAMLSALVLAGCQSRNVLRMSETTPDQGTFSLVYRTVGDAESKQGVEYIGPDWSLTVQSDSAMVSPAHEAMAAQLTALAGALAKALGRFPW